MDLLQKISEELQKGNFNEVPKLTPKALTSCSCILSKVIKTFFADSETPIPMTTLAAVNVPVDFWI